MWCQYGIGFLGLCCIVAEEFDYNLNRCFGLQKYNIRDICICSSRVQEPFWLKALCVSNAVWRKKLRYKYCPTGVAVQWTSGLNYTKVEVHNNL